MLNHLDIIHIFNQEFTDFRTTLVGGVDEPLYLPDTGNGAILYFRADYESSALHEISHWCIAGLARLKLEDFGYWYAPDGRSSEQQNQFYQFEIKPQALESIFSDAAEIPFNISADNLLGEDLGAFEAFKENVFKQKALYLDQGLPPRGQRFLRAIKERL